MFRLCTYNILKYTEELVTYVTALPFLFRHTLAERTACLPEALDNQGARILGTVGEMVSDSAAVHG